MGHSLDGVGFEPNDYSPSSVRLGGAFLGNGRNDEILKCLSLANKRAFNTSIDDDGIGTFLYQQRQTVPRTLVWMSREGSQSIELIAVLLSNNLLVD